MTTGGDAIEIQCSDEPPVRIIAVQLGQPVEYEAHVLSVETICVFLAWELRVVRFCDVSIRQGDVAHVGMIQAHDDISMTCQTGQECAVRRAPGTPAMRKKKNRKGTVLADPSILDP